MIRNMILEITIPTYNRPKQIRETIQKLLPQLNDDVSITIIDNASPTPVTHEMLGIEDAGLRGKVRIMRNRVNIGGDANILRCFEVCEAPYMWLLGDDDDPLPASIETILNDIKNNPDILYINYTLTPRTRNLKISGLKDFIKSIDFWYNILAMSNGVYCSGKIQSALPKAYRLANSMACHAILLMETLRSSEQAVYLSSKSVISCPDNYVTQWSYFDYLNSVYFVLSIDMDNASRKILGKKISRESKGVNYIFTVCALIANKGDKQNARILYAQTIAKIYPYISCANKLKSLPCYFLLLMPALSLRIMKLLGMKKRIDMVCKMEQSLLSKLS
jgi:abequosyltransferase